MLRNVITCSIVCASVLVARAADLIPSSIDAIRHAIEHPNAETTSSWLKYECPGKLETSVLFPQSTDGKYALVEAFSDECAAMPLVLFKSVDGITWTYSDTIQFALAFGTRPEVRLVEFVRKGITDLLVQHEIVSWGSGVQQEDISIYRISDGHLKCVLEEQESMVYAPIPWKRTVEQRSKFEIREYEPGNVIGGKYLHEEQRIRIGKQTLRRFRSCSWDERKQRFLCKEESE